MSEELKKAVAEFLEVGSTQPENEPTVEDPSTEEPSEEGTPTEEPSGDESSVEESSTEEPSTEEPSTEEPTAEELPVEKDELTLLKEQNEQLIKMINALSGQSGESVEQPADQKKKVEAKPDEGAKPPVTEQPKIKGFTEGFELEQILTNREVFETVLARAVEMAQIGSYTNIMKSLPLTVSKMVTHTSAVSRVIDEFYKTNKDLVPVRSFVGKSMNQIAGEHPEMTLPQLLDETAKQVRKALGLQNVKKPQASKPNEPAKPKPAFAKTGGARSGGDSKLTHQQKQISSIL